MAAKQTDVTLGPEWIRISDMPQREITKLRFLLRHAHENGIVEKGAALKYGREWFINRAALAEFLKRRTLDNLRAKA